MIQYKALTWRQIEKLDKPGFYTLPFFAYDHNVEVVYATPNIPAVSMKVIIVRMDDGSFQDFYYNDSDAVFKPLTVNCFDEDYENDTIDNYRFGVEWENSGVGVECPKEYANCVGHCEDIFAF
jgi:hypothetical protein